MMQYVYVYVVYVCVCVMFTCTVIYDWELTFHTYRNYSRYVHAHLLFSDTPYFSPT